MRKTLIIALSLASLGALASVQTASAAGSNCHKVCYASKTNYDSKGKVISSWCTDSREVCSIFSGSTSGKAPTSLQDQRNMRQK